MVSTFFFQHYRLLVIFLLLNTLMYKLSRFCVLCLPLIYPLGELLPVLQNIDQVSLKGK